MKTKEEIEQLAKEEYPALIGTTQTGVGYDMNAREKEAYIKGYVQSQIDILNEEIKDYVSRFDLKYIKNLLDAINKDFIIVKENNIVLKDDSVYFESAMGLYKIIAKSFEKKIDGYFFKYNKWAYYIDGKLSEFFTIKKATQTLLFSQIIQTNISKKD